MTLGVIEDHGYFWWGTEPVPAGQLAPSSAVTGFLKIDSDGKIELELHGFLSDEGPLAALAGNGPISKPIYGKLKSSTKHVVLSDLYRSGARLGGFSFEKFVAFKCLYTDFDFPDASKPLLFTRLDADLEGFEEWLRLGSITTTRGKRSLKSAYRPPREIRYALEDATLAIRFNLIGPYPGRHRSHYLTLKEWASICFTPKRRVSLDEMRDEFALIEDLLIVLTGSEYCLGWPTVIGANKLGYQFIFTRRRSAAKAPEWHECWTNFPKLRDSFGSLFSNWRRKRAEFGPGFYMYLGTRRGHNLLVENRFVNMIWGIEALHRRKFPVPEMSKRMRTKIDRILKQIGAKKDRQWLARRLEHADEPPLDQRMFEILKDLPLGLDSAVLRAFCEQCSRTRNDISHFGGPRKEEKYSEFALRLDKQSNALSYLYHSLLLQEIGVEGSILRWWVFEGYRSYPIKSAFVGVGLLPANALNPQNPSNSESTEQQATPVHADS